MSQRPSRRFFLADLVFAALMCGLIAALFLSPRGDTNAALISVLIGVVAAGWGLFHQRRQAPTCEECGRRFIQPKKAAESPDSCPHCGREQLARKRSIWRVKKIFWGLLGSLVFLVAVAAVGFTGFTGGPYEGIAMFAGLIAAVSVQLTLLAWFGVGFYLSRLTRPKERPCEACGAIIPLEQPAGSMTCPQCRLRHLRPEEAKKEKVRNLGILLIFIGSVAVFASFLFPRSSGSRSGMSSWIGFLLVVLASFAAVLVVMVVVLVFIQLLRRRQLRSERGTLAMARKAAGREGEVVKEGLWTIWYSGLDDPASMLREQWETAARRFAILTGAAFVAEPPLRIFVFHDRGAFLRFHMRILVGVDLASVDGIHLGVPYHSITLCTAEAPCRITDPERTIRSLAAYVLLESIGGPRLPAWVQSGLARSVAGGDDRDERARLNRKMVASIARGTALSAEMFTTTLKSLMRLLRGPKDPRDLQKVVQFHYQSWSIIEYLRGEPAPQDPRTALGAFLRDPRSKTNQEEAFRLHFGLGFEPLLDGWRQWVLDQGISTYEPPPDRIRDGLLERVLPAIRDRQAKRGDRLVAIGEWANAGFILGSDALLDLLREPGDLPIEHIVWALCMVSGMAWGDDPDRWQAWWDDLSPTWDETPEPAESPSDGPPSEPIATASDGANEAALLDR